MKKLCLGVPRKKAQGALMTIRENKLLSPDIEIVEEDGIVYIPLNVSGPEDLSKTISALGMTAIKDLAPLHRPPKSYKDLLDLPPDLQEELPSSFDVIGDVCIIKLPSTLMEYAGRIGNAILGANRSLKKVAMDGGVKGEFRLRDLTVIAGDKNLETVHIENNVRLKLDPSLVYFSPRLSSERLRISSLAGKGRVLDMFCGVGPFALTVARHSEANEIVGIDLNPDCIRYFNTNISINSVEDRVNAILGDARDIAPTLGSFDRIIMNLPHSSLDFLESALQCIHEGTIHMYSITEGSSIMEEISRIDSILKRSGRDHSISFIKEVHQYSPTSHMMVFDLSVTA
jgi:tRNA (guanine37-N1)-methyltransferase